MATTFLVGVRGESYQNDDGTNRQDIIKKLKTGQFISLVADPMNEHDRFAVAVLTSEGKQIGFLPSGARDSSAILKGEPMSATVYKLTGGTNWFNRNILGKKYIGVVLQIIKYDIDFSETHQYWDIADKIDKQVTKAEQTEKKGNKEQAIKEYKAVVDDIYQLTEQDKHASAYRFKPAPINRLSMCLEKQKKLSEALELIERYENTFDPVRPSKREMEMINKRKNRLIKKMKLNKQ